jgi:hypothetical protein
MAERIHELLLRNLQEVFGEGDPAKRRSAIKDLYTDDCVLYVPPGPPQFRPLKWGSGPRGGVPAYTGEDVIIVRDERSQLFTFFLTLPCDRTG